MFCKQLKIHTEYPLFELCNFSPSNTIFPKELRNYYQKCHNHTPREHQHQEVHEKGKRKLDRRTMY